jgi:hypothetical protein
MRNKKAFLSFVFVSITGLFVFETPSLAGKLVIQDYVVKVRKAPSLVGPSVGELKHNDTVDEIERRNNFVKIKTRGLEGWVPLSAVTSESKANAARGEKYLDEVEKNTETRDSDITKFKVKGGLKPGQQEKTGK